MVGSAICLRVCYALSGTGRVWGCYPPTRALLDVRCSARLRETSDLNPDLVLIRRMRVPVAYGIVVLIRRVSQEPRA
eukprot:3426852-Rhodomonas_salina.6